MRSITSDTNKKAHVSGRWLLTATAGVAPALGDANSPGLPDASTLTACGVAHSVVCITAQVIGILHATYRSQFAAVRNDRTLLVHPLTTEIQIQMNATAFNEKQKI